MIFNDIYLFVYGNESEITDFLCDLQEVERTRDAFNLIWSRKMAQLVLFVHMHLF